MCKDRGIERVHRLIISSSQQSVQIVAMYGHNHIDKTARPGERTLKTAVFLTILQRSVENQKLNINRNQESITSTIPFRFWIGHSGYACNRVGTSQ